MTPTAYYNEIDPFAAQWLRNLIVAGHIAPGEVDERSIEDVTPEDLRGFTQCHFFAGIGAWSHSLRLAGWPDDKQVWTGSCPCQPFSAAGKGDGFADERHLWPHFFHLIRERRPEHVFGEQVAAGNANAWFDLVQADLEGVGYAFGLVPFAAAGVGAPHIRERAYWVANTNSIISDRGGYLRTSGRNEYSNGCDDVRLADAGRERCKRINPLLQREKSRRNAEGVSEVARFGASDRLAHTDNEQHSIAISRCSHEYVSAGRQQDPAALAGLRRDCRALEVNGFWRDADWLLCRDGKWRPVEPGTFPLVDGAAARLGRVESGVARVASSNRVGRLKGYGNAINAQAAAEFIRAYMEGL
ncbi:DNA cytosine methyltransferase [Citrobacter braakii]|jgi:DNA (cytosine-5)-methyltransferase 1|uniref:DNA cytosine methyltransferase n=1 Tax=Citrobacter braakii TaxID=57706 RepID=UPI001E3BAFA1|nr:DNA cytosine methyltransferase [Citrobacter braakii]MCD9263250.1 DNA cytosine methyltransferase [Citrobacter braakii]MDX7345717.1 DNA cytosine methyltransferase [Citrobacter braakii]